MKNVYIFDLDGVIVDTAKFHFQVWKDISQELGLHFDEALNEKLKGVSRGRCLDIILDNTQINLSELERQDILRRKNGYYLNYIRHLNQTDVMPGILNLFNQCKKNGVHICLGSASKNAISILDKLNITHYFDVIIDGNQVSKAKPDPEIFIRSSDILNISPKDCIVFEDSIAGIIAAKNAGMYSVGVGDEKILKEADIVFADLSEFSIQ